MRRLICWLDGIYGLECREKVESVDKKPCNCVSVGYGWLIDKASDQKMPNPPLPPPPITARRQVPIKLNERQVRSACLSYDHSFGLMSKDDQDRLKTQAKWWFNAFENEGLVKTVDAVEKESKN